jgi:hypothetical protein
MLIKLYRSFINFPIHSMNNHRRGNLRSHQYYILHTLLYNEPGFRRKGTGRSNSYLFGRIESPTLWPTHSPSHCIPGILFQGIKWSVHEVQSSILLLALDSTVVLGLGPSRDP